MKSVEVATGRLLDGPSDTAGARGSEVGSWVIASAAFLLVAFRQTYVIPALPLSLSPARLLLFGGAALFIIACLLGHQSKYRLGVMAPVLAIYVISTATAYGIGMTREAIPIKTVDYYFVVEIMLVLSVLFYFNVIHSYVGLRRVIKGLVAGAFVSAVFAILAHTTGVELARVLRPPGLIEKGAILTGELVRGDVVRPQGSADHPLELAAVLTITFPLAVGLAYSLRAAGERWRAWAAVAAVILVGVAVSVSRSALIGLLAAYIVMATFWPIRRTLAVLGAGAGLATLVFVANPALFQAYSSTVGLGRADPSAQYRLAAARYILSHFSMFGSFGQGGGADNYVFDDQYLYRLAETGVAGLLAYLILLGTTFALALRAFLNARDEANTQLPTGSSQLLLGLVASLAAYATMNVVLDVGGFAQIWTTMWILVATSAVAWRISRKPHGRAERRAVGRRDGMGRDGMGIVNPTISKAL